MSDSGDVVALAARIRELEAQLVRVPSLGGLRDSTNCTDCGSNCTNCRGDRLLDVLLPGEMEGLSGRELASRLAVSRGK
jgi:hypothetical protein